MKPKAAVLYPSPTPPPAEIFIRPESLRPGVTPPRFAGRPPKCFFALLKSFLELMFAGQPPEPEFVHQKLRENPAFARTCGFTIPRPGKPARQSDLPSLRKLQQFDQIMTDNGLWAELALDQVADNLRNGTLRTESTVVHDTTHDHAYSAMKVVELKPTATETPMATKEAATKEATEATTEPPATADATNYEAKKGIRRCPQNANEKQQVCNQWYLRRTTCANGRRRAFHSLVVKNQF